MGDQQTTVPASTSSTSGTSQPTAGKQNRGRGGRFPSRGRGMTTMQKAKADINPHGAPIELSSKFGGFQSLTRGNAKVTIDHGFTERVLIDYRKTISANQESKGYFDQEGKPHGLSDLTNGLGAGLCISTALKLLDATPESGIPKTSTFRSLRESKLHVPRTFVQLLDLIGKTDYQDWVIRIKYNTDLIQRFLLKAIKYISHIQNFVETETWFNDEDLARFRGLDNLPYASMHDVYFATTDSVASIKERALAWLRDKMRTNFFVRMVPDDENSAVAFSYPQLPNDNPTKDQIVSWLGLFNANVHPDFSQIIAAGTLLLVNVNWLEHPTKKLIDFDRDLFEDTPVADLTPVNMLNACGLRHLYEFVSRKVFIELSRSALSYYQEHITQRLSSIFYLVNQGTSTLGNPAQLVFCPRDFVNKKKKIDDIDYVDIDSSLNHCLSYVKLDIADKIVKSAMIGLVKEVDLDPDYEGNFKSQLKVIAGSFLTKDGLNFSYSKQFG